MIYNPKKFEEIYISKIYSQEYEINIKENNRNMDVILSLNDFNFKYDFNNYKISYDYSITRGENLSAEKPLSYINPDKQIVNFTYRKNFIDYNLRFSPVIEKLKEQNAEQRRVREWRQANNYNVGTGNPII